MKLRITWKEILTADNQASPLQKQTQVSYRAGKTKTKTFCCSLLA